MTIKFKFKVLYSVRVLKNVLCLNSSFRQIMIASLVTAYQDPKFWETSLNSLKKNNYVKIIPVIKLIILPYFII